VSDFTLSFSSTFGGTNQLYSIIREPSTPQRYQSQSRQNERDARNLGSPENCRTPAQPPQEIAFQGQQYQHLPVHLIAGVQRTQALDTRARGLSRSHRGSRNTYSAPTVSYY